MSAGGEESALCKVEIAVNQMNREGHDFQSCRSRCPMDMGFRPLSVGLRRREEQTAAAETGFFSAG